MKNIISQEEKNRIDQVCKKYYIENYTINGDGSVDVDGVVDLASRELSSLPLRFGRVNGDFTCVNNGLTTLEGSPIIVTGYFFCFNNKLTSLEGGPRVVDGLFYCNDNRLTTLEHSPEKLGVVLFCNNNQITTLTNCSTKSATVICCDGNKLSTLTDLPKNLVVITAKGNNFSQVFNVEFSALDKDEKTIFLQYQDYYDVWLPVFSEENMHLLIADIKDGLR
jgi:hypothetical protein